LEISAAGDELPAGVPPFRSSLDATPRVLDVEMLTKLRAAMLPK
jgi:hypothetical protein